MKICMVTGGSGGHIYPALTFADFLRNNSEHEVVFIGNDHKMESRIIPEHGYPFYAIHNQGLQGSVFDKVRAVLGQFAAIRAAKKHLKVIKPDLVFAFGGYVSLPVVMAAKQCGIKIALHEQNAFVGKANQMASKSADVIFTCYKEAFAGRENVYQMGNPRAALINEPIDSSIELARLNLDLKKRIVLIVMGSQGSSSMNKLFKEALPLLNDSPYQIVIVTGPQDYDTFIQGLVVPDSVRIQPFVDQKALLPHLDLILARAGASTITEIAAFGLPSILVPSPYVANNHQYYNAKALADIKATVLLAEKDLTAEKLVGEINRLMIDKNQLRELSQNVKKLATPNVNRDILKILEEKVVV